MTEDEVVVGPGTIISPGVRALPMIRIIQIHPRCNDVTTMNIRRRQRTIGHMANITINSSSNINQGVVPDPRRQCHLRLPLEDASRLRPNCTVLHPRTRLTTDMAHRSKSDAMIDTIMPDGPDALRRRHLNQGDAVRLHHEG